MFFFLVNLSVFFVNFHSKSLSDLFRKSVRFMFVMNFHCCLISVFKDLFNFFNSTVVVCFSAVVFCFQICMKPFLSYVKHFQNMNFINSCYWWWIIDFTYISWNFFHIFHLFWILFKITFVLFVQMMFFQFRKIHFSWFKHHFNHWVFIWLFKEHFLIVL